MFAPYKNLSLVSRLFLLLGLLLFNYFLFGLVALMLSTLIFGNLNGHLASSIIQTDADRYAFLFLEGFASLGAFGFTALLFSQLESGHVAEHMGLKKLPPLKMLLLAIAAILVAQFFIDFLVTVNKYIPVPPSFHEQEQKTAQLTGSLTTFSSFGQFLVTALVLAVVPAIAEEFLFRGVILGDLLKARMGAFTSIAISGFLFALAHLEFSNTLAIWVLGMFLGYLYYVSGSIWLSCAAHFVNNFITLLLTYLYQIKVLKTDITTLTMPWYLILAGALVFAGALFVFNKWKTPFVVDADNDRDDFIGKPYSTH